jgi:hypothetical protein
MKNEHAIERVCMMRNLQYVPLNDVNNNTFKQEQDKESNVRIFQPVWQSLLRNTIYALGLLDLAFLITRKKLPCLPAT